MRVSVLVAALAFGLIACGAVTSTSETPSDLSPDPGEIVSDKEGPGPQPLDDDKAGVRGEVIDEKGRPVARAKVSTESMDGFSVPGIAIWSGRDGLYSWPAVLFPGTYVVTASKAGYEPESKTAALPGGAVTIVNFVLESHAD